MSKQRTSSYYTYNNLENCNRSLRESIQLLQRTRELLQDTTLDAERLPKILNTKRVYGLIPEFDLEDARTNYKSSITPQITEQMLVIEDEVQQLVQKRDQLQSKLNLVRGRLSNYEEQHDNVKKDLNLNLDLDLDLDLDLLVNNQSYDQEQLQRLRMLRNRKKRLQHTLSRSQYVPNLRYGS